jgi:hypothetical protein
VAAEAQGTVLVDQDDGLVDHLIGQHGDHLALELCDQERKEWRKR